MTDPSQINNSLNQQLPTNGKQLITAAILRVALTTGGAGLLGLTGWIAATFAGLTSNNTFTGSNTHTGPEVFTGSVVLPAGTITGSLGYTPAHSGANSDIFSINGLLTPLAPDQGGTGLIAFIKAGSTNTFATSSGPFVAGHCLQADSGANVVDAGGPCTTGGGGGTVSAGSAGNLAYYSASGIAVTGLANGTSSQVLTGGASPAWGALNLGTMTTGQLPVANGGTGAASVSAARAALSAASSGANSDITSLTAVTSVSLPLAPHVGTYAALTASPTTAYPDGVWRDDFAVGAGAPPLLFKPTTLPCTLNYGAGDGGSQVPSADGLCWIANAGIANILNFGADRTGVNPSDTAWDKASVAAGAGAIVYMPLGHYKYNAQHTTALGQCVVGDSSSMAGGTEWDYTGTSGSALILLGDSACSTRFWFNAPKTAQPPAGTLLTKAGTWCLQLSNGIENPARQSVEDVQFTGCDTQLSILSGFFLAHSKGRRRPIWNLRVAHPESRRQRQRRRRS